MFEWEREERRDVRGINERIERGVSLSLSFPRKLEDERERESGREGVRGWEEGNPITCSQPCSQNKQKRKKRTGFGRLHLRLNFLFLPLSFSHSSLPSFLEKEKEKRETLLVPTWTIQSRRRSFSPTAMTSEFPAGTWFSHSLTHFSFLPSFVFPSTSLSFTNLSPFLSLPSSSSLSPSLPFLFSLSFSLTHQVSCQKQ